MIDGDNIGFDDRGRPIPICWPDDLDQVEPVDRSAEALHAITCGLLLCLESGHRDACRTRCAALACILQLFDSPAHCARILKVNRATISRAVQSMKRELRNGTTKAKARTVNLT